MEGNTMSTDLRIDANPTKEFFIYMLTKDIGLSRSILDLIDNCVDGAIRIRDTERYDGLYIHIIVDNERLHISDNCGGIDIEIARKYAFRFGRSSEVTPVKHSIGQFGVGMKRALFKIGTQFSIRSKTEINSFLMNGNVDEWKTSPEWTFFFQEANEKESNSIDETGTTVEITNLLPNVIDSFFLDNFKKELSMEIAEAHQKAISKGLFISFNGIPLRFKQIELLKSDVLNPVKIIETIRPTPDIEVIITIIAGIGESEPKEAGWYIYCNGRLVLNADQTNVTGWGEEEGALIPQFHNRSASFRGYVFFESDNAAALPWNTTKTGIDKDSKIYQMIRQKMIVIMRPIIDILNKLSRERDPEEIKQTITPIVASATKTKIDEIPENSIFTISTDDTPATILLRDASIQYRKPIEEISKIKKSLCVASNKEVGELTFDYYYEMECK